MEAPIMINNIVILLKILYNKIVYIGKFLKGCG